MQISYSPAQRVRGPDATNSPVLVVTPDSVGGSSSTATVASLDMQVQRTTTTGSTTQVKLSVLDPRGPGPAPVLASPDPTNCDIAPDGTVSRRFGDKSSSRDVEVIASVPGFALRWQGRLAKAASSTVDVYQGYAPGSLAAHIDAAIRAMVAGKNPGAAAQKMLSSASGNAQSPAAVRNPALFTGALDLSAISLYRDTKGWGYYPCVLVTRRHIITGHSAPQVGERFVWQLPGGGYEVRTVAARARMNLPQGEDYVAILDADANASLPRMALMPATWASKLPSINTAPARLPVLNKANGAGNWMRVLENGTAIAPGWLGLSKARDVQLAPWSSDIIGGDSNGPVVVPVNGAPVLLHCMNTTAGGAHYSTAIAGIQAQLDALSAAAGTGNQSLTLADLSGFASY